MRVIGGEFRSRRLKALPGLDTRPTPDRLRETLFDILAARVVGALFLDAYAGSGAVGIEALSRGAREAIFVEKSHRAIDVIRQNLKSLGIEERAQVICGNSQVVLARFCGADPPVRGRPPGRLSAETNRPAGGPAADGGVRPTSAADIVFLDPPYAAASEYSEALAVLGESPPPLAIAQHSSRQRLEERYERLARFRTVRQGDNVLSFYSVEETK